MTLVVPSSLRIIGKDYEVQHKDKAASPEDLGLCDDEAQIINVRIDIADDSIIETLLHECIHAISSGMKLSLTERQVHGLGVGLYALFKDNPDLVSLLPCPRAPKPTHNFF